MSRQCCLAYRGRQNPNETNDKTRQWDANGTFWGDFTCEHPSRHSAAREVVSIAAWFGASPAYVPILLTIMSRPQLPSTKSSVASKTQFELLAVDDGYDESEEEQEQQEESEQQSSQQQSVTFSSYTLFLCSYSHYDRYDMSGCPNLLN